MKKMMNVHGVDMEVDEITEQEAIHDFVLLFVQKAGLELTDIERVAFTDVLTKSYADNSDEVQMNASEFEFITDKDQVRPAVKGLFDKDTKVSAEHSRMLSTVKVDEQSDQVTVTLTEAFFAMFQQAMSATVGSIRFGLDDHADKTTDTADDEARD